MAKDRKKIGTVEKNGFGKQGKTTTSLSNTFSILQSLSGEEMVEERGEGIQMLVTHVSKAKD